MPGGNPAVYPSPSPAVGAFLQTDKSAPPPPNPHRLGGGGRPSELRNSGSATWAVSIYNERWMGATNPYHFTHIHPALNSRVVEKGPGGGVCGPPRGTGGPAATDLAAHCLPWGTASHLIPGHKALWRSSHPPCLLCGPFHCQACGQIMMTLVAKKGCDVLNDANVFFNASIQDQFHLIPQS